MQVPVVRSGSVLTQAVTPRSVSPATDSRPRASSPTRPTYDVGTPCAASQTATLAADPPPAVVTADGVSLPRARGPDMAASTAPMTSPTTTTSRVSVPSGTVPSARPLGVGSGSGDPRGQLGVVQDDADVGLQRHALALAVEELEQERRHVLTPHRGALGGRQPVVQQPLVQGRVDLLVHRER